MQVGEGRGRQKDVACGKHGVQCTSTCRIQKAASPLHPPAVCCCVTFSSMLYEGDERLANYYCLQKEKGKGIRSKGLFTFSP